MSPGAKVEWVRVAEQLAALDMLKSVDEGALAAYCQSRERWIQAEQTVELEGQTVREPVMSRQGEVAGWKIRRHPATIIAKDEKLAMKVFAGLFGFDPSSRSKMTVPQAPKKSVLDALLDGDNEQATVN